METPVSPQPKNINFCRGYGCCNKSHGRRLGLLYSDNRPSKENIPLPPKYFVRCPESWWRAWNGDTEKDAISAWNAGNEPYKIKASIPVKPTHLSVVK